jgi:endonuclease-3
MARESKQKKATRTIEIVARLNRHYPDAKCSLEYGSVHQLLVATILSAQCTDERVNAVTKDLFKRYRTIADFADADLEELERDVRATGFFRNKAKAIKNSARQIIERHGGTVPRTLAQLVKLEGVGRKTASVVLGAGCGLAEGIVVDTHVGRISRRLGLTTHEDAVKVEQDLMPLVPTSDWIGFSHRLIVHGRAVCAARKPKCGECFLRDLCPSAD